MKASIPERKQGDPCDHPAYCLERFQSAVQGGDPGRVWRSPGAEETQLAGHSSYSRQVG